MTTKKVYLVETSYPDHRKRQLAWQEQSRHDTYREALDAAAASGVRPWRIRSTTEIVAEASAAA